MRTGVKIGIAILGAVVAIGGACVGYHAYDVKAHGFVEAVSEICPEEAVELALQAGGESLNWKTSAGGVVELGEGNTVTGVSPGETTVVAGRGIHWYKCRVVVREHSYAEADCVTPQTCTLCAYTAGEPLGHDGSEPACTEPGICSRCGVETAVMLGHEEKAQGCLEPVVCARCKKVVGKAPGHKFSAATCTDPAVCAGCGGTEGEALGHAFSAATCTKPAACARCGKTEGKALGHDLRAATCAEPAVCRRCGEKQGEPLGHNYAPATCIAPKTCKRCRQQEGNALGHDYAPATCAMPSKCRRCGQVTGGVLGHDYRMVESGTEGERNYEKFRCANCGDEYAEYHATETSAYQAMMALESTYPSGTPWDNSNYYDWNGGIYFRGYGCAGFAFMLSDAAFGTAPARLYNDSLAIRVGDIVRLDDDRHSVIVLEVRSDSVIVAEGNYNSSVNWGREISMDELASANYFMTRY